MVDIDPITHQRNFVLSTFINMPLDVANLVLDKMEPMDLLRARKVCRSLRTAVDKFGLRFDHIVFLLMKDKVEICWNGMDENIFMSYQYRYIRYTEAANGSGTKIIYNTAENGSSSSNVIHNEQTKLIDGENFVEKAAKDFMILSKHARKIKIRNYTEDRCDIVTTFIKIFKAEKCIHVKEIELWRFGFDEFLTILPFFDAKELKTIKLMWMKSIDRFERITQLEQWKNAEHLEFSMSKITSTVFLNFFHFKFFRIHDLKEFPAQTSIQIRDDLLRRSTFQSGTICFEKSKIHPIEFAKVFKPDYDGGNEFKFEYSNGNDKFEILLKTWMANSDYFQFHMKRL